MTSPYVTDAVAESLVGLVPVSAVALLRDVWGKRILGRSHERRAETVRQRGE
jgi:hypothetical protein